ncbi:BglG family transcription antiterminator [Anaeropeptidivorans aminofermentans]|jgi:mannitol operon transcriptional antiterminator|uniref:BglG family transcription antiterminator n=1 Tax=Anaeropeptidivorans aminofermentans TaxID=2934315 RepID=UPI0020241559|nr:transcription antiterminator [Anaeropeptidivorans aminofermentans]
MDLNSRCVKLLIKIAKENSGIGLHKLALEFDITRRVLSYDIAKINEWLKHYNLGAVHIAEGKAFVGEGSKEEIIRKAEAFDGYIYSIEERRAIEYLYIALSAEPVKVEFLVDFFDVSYNTIIADIKELKAYLKENKIALTSSGKKGYVIYGEEGIIRKIIGEKFQFMEEGHPREIFFAIIQESLMSLTGIDCDFLSFAQNAVKGLESSVSTTKLLTDMDYSIAMILVSCIRSRKGFFFSINNQEKAAIEKAQGYDAIQKMTERFNEIALSLPGSEVYYITILFLGTRNFEGVSPESDDYHIDVFFKRLISDFERAACVYFPKEEYLHNLMFSHIRSMYYRLKYGVHIKNYLLPQIKSMYPDNFFFTKKALEISAGGIFKMITEEEASFICTYMTSLLNAKESKNKSRLPLIGICSLGADTSVFLREQLIDFLGDNFSYEFITNDSVDAEKAYAYCVIVSAVPLEKEYENVVYTDAILTSGDKRKILCAVNKKNTKSAVGFDVSEIIDAVKKHSVIQDEDGLYLELVKLQMRGAGGKGIEGNHIALPELLKKEGTVIKALPISFDYALLEACKGLAKNAELIDFYMKQMIDHGQKDKSVYEFVPGFGLEYFHDPAGEVGVSITLFEEERLIAYGKRLKGLVVLSCIDNKSHYKLLRSIYEFFEKADNIKMLMKNADY